VTVDAGALAVDRVRVEALRCGLGARLATYRRAAGVSQPELGQAIGRTRTTVSKIEKGTRGMPGALWKVTDEVCRAEGALVAEYSALADAERDYRGRWRAHQRQARQATAQVDVDALRVSPGPSEAARVLGDAASLASLSPLLTARLHATRALMQPWDGTQAVTTLDAQLEASGLGPGVPV
jgi:transcriptional regulator with XRE-family HTH domain